ncbi:MAG TPA: hypothetical protein VE988_21095 [Gemmataceae bacterium]|nr:hypothetical protein [Gemmataceae bacterium]
MRIYGLTAVILLASSIATAADQGAWQQYRTKDLNFRASFPANPKETSSQTGKVLVKGVMLDLNERAFAVLVSDIPGARHESEKMTESRLDSARDSITAKFKLEIEKKITIAVVLRGREILASNDNGIFVRSRIFLVNGRLYQVMVAGPRDFVTGADAEKFLDSFVLTQ